MKTLKTNHSELGRFALASIVMLMVGLQSSPAKEKQPVTISYVVRPAKPMPETIRSVAVIDSGVDTTDGIKGDVRSRRWSGIAAEMIESMLQSTPTATPTPNELTVVQRRATKKILEEQDLRLAGIVEGDSVTRVGKLLAVQGLVMSKISIRVDTRKQNKETVDWTRFLGAGRVVTGENNGPRYRPAPGGGYYVNPYRRPVRETRVDAGVDLPMKTITEISRNLTVQCSFALVDAQSGRSLVQFPPRMYQKTDKAKPNFVFGRCVEEADLDPVDQFIGELVERAVRDFVGSLVPTRVTYSYELIGKGKHGEAAIRALRADEFATALKEFEAAHHDDPKRDWHVFGMAVCCELLGDFEKALLYYRQAASMPDVDKDDLPTYLAAKDRLAAHLDRIAPSSIEGGAQMSSKH